jgi:hypothetical protein
MAEKDTYLELVSAAATLSCAACYLKGNALKSSDSKNAIAEWRAVEDAEAVARAAWNKVVEHVAAL